MDYQVRVAITQDPANAEFFGKPEPVYERLVLGHVVGGGKVNLQRVSELVAFGRGEDDTGSQAGAHLGPIEVRQ